jgi:hypothetical protein
LIPQIFFDNVTVFIVYNVERQQLLNNRGAPYSVGIEFLHPTPKQVNFETLAAGIDMAFQLYEAGAQVDLFVFVDDIELSQRPAKEFWKSALQIVPMRSLQQALAEVPAVVHLILESDMIGRAHVLVDEVRSQAEKNPDAARLNQSGDTITFGSGKEKQRIRLTGYGNHPDLPSCDAMDLACYTHKFSEFGLDETITLIPEKYREQQQRVRKLAGFLGLKALVEVIYVDEEGWVSDRESWLPGEVVTTSN